ncbi:MAG: hypothetical protein MMC23_002120 [Stictis urceolatum]|nr:hypothetical protein [Stictis urceolata]
MSSPIKPEPTSATESSQTQPAFTDGAADAVLDADPDVDMAGVVPPEAIASSAQDPANNDGAADEPRQEALDLNIEEARMPLRKDVSLREFLSKMDDYAPVIPDAVTFQALTLAGLPPPPLSSSAPQPSSPSNPSTSQPPPQSSEPHTPLHLSRLLALATQKFIADIAADAYQYSRMRSGTLTSNTLSALSNPGAPGPGIPGAPGAAAAGGAAGGVGAAGTVGGGGGKQAGQHVLGMQRPGFGGGGQGGGQGRTVLTMEDLGMAVGEYGVNVRRGEFYR